MHPLLLCLRCEHGRPASGVHTEHTLVQQLHPINAAGIVRVPQPIPKCSRLLSMDQAHDAATPACPCDVQSVSKLRLGMSS
eukprot:1161721-Pelagomonas_calceolata.AAC.2